MHLLLAMPLAGEKYLLPPNPISPSHSLRRVKTLQAQKAPNRRNVGDPEAKNLTCGTPSKWEFFQQVYEI
jgi:hypothetical protein